MNKCWMIGGIGYPLLEIMYRRRTHPSMALAGALGCAALHRISRGRGNLLHKSVLGACAVTGIEYLIGQIFNRRHHIWDYRGMKGNIHGQICPQFMLAWLGLSGICAFLFRKHMV